MKYCSDGSMLEYSFVLALAFKTDLKQNSRDVWNDLLDSKSLNSHIISIICK